MDDSSSHRTLRSIAVAGGTGTVGSHVVDLARRRGHRVVSLSRADGIDLVTGRGVHDALAGVETVIDVSSRQTQKAGESREFFGAVTTTLLSAEESSGVGHHVALSVVGTDRAPHGYYAGKQLQEDLVSASAVPWTVLRATQFHEFVGQIFGAVRVGPVVVVPRMVCRPVAAAEVAGRLLDLVEAGPSGRARDLVGPRVESMPAMVRAWARATGRTGRVISVPLPGPLGKAMRDGTLVGGPGADLGTMTFDEWLARQPAGR